MLICLGKLDGNVQIRFKIQLNEDLPLDVNAPPLATPFTV